MASSVLVLGASSGIGLEVVRQLARRSIPVTAVVRDINKSKSVLPSGVSLDQVDYNNPATFTQAAQKAHATKVFLYDHAVKEPIFAALKAGGVKHVAFLSTCWIGLDIKDSALQRKYEEFESKIVNSGFTYTLLRPDSFCSNTFWWKYGIAHGKFASPHPDAQIKVVAFEDIAAVVVQAFSSNDYNNNSVNIIGPEPLSERQQLAILSEVLGKPLELEVITDNEWTKRQKGILPDESITSLLNHYIFRGLVGPEKQNPKVDKTVIGKLTFREFATKHKDEYNL